MLKPTPVYPRVAALCKSRKWQSWEGYIMADTYNFSVMPEYLAIRNTAALFDFFPLYVYLIRGADAALLLDRLITRNINKCKIGQVMYTALCDAEGKLLDDGTVYRFDETTFQLTTNTPTLDWVQANSIGLQVEIQDKTLTTNTLPLQGPKSRTILNQVADTNLDGLKYFNFVETKIRDIPVVISRTGYTGDLGYEVWSEAKDAIALWDILMEAGSSEGIQPAGFYALDLARIEAGLIWYEYDYIPSRQAQTDAEKVSPLEVSLAWTVDFSKASFIGREALLKEKEQGVQRQLVGLELDRQFLHQTYGEQSLFLQDLRTPWRTKFPVRVGEQTIGQVTSGCWSPAGQNYIAIASVSSNYAQATTSLAPKMSVEIHGQTIPASIKSLPFYDPDHKRSTATSVPTLALA
ncbi:MAG: Aminomethyltransferase [Chroococcidiopsis sp. SAG 2025]|uniref:aminomethyltransferase family protein n=1 Tax=Chroococcidiopsis sp. SAG 2025 TaxID=171389 RepID=UPI0029371A80|nr:aminomethyltransferase family protein [Chroococcidiopsis sp. SAG 2025]MDV2995342.1 Aminomethyltransferase [Chroococcidiopsis sp. SAG 2025]